MRGGSEWKKGMFRFMLSQQASVIDSYAVSFSLRSHHQTNNHFVVDPSFYVLFSSLSLCSYVFWTCDCSSYPHQRRS